VERVLQLLDDVDDLAAWAHQAWLPLAKRAAGLAGLLTLTLVVFLPH
jgi:hypothetical protein